VGWYAAGFDLKSEALFTSCENLHHPTTHDLDARNQYFDWKRFLRNGISRSVYSLMKQEELLHASAVARIKSYP
jgi:hypothetical protein